MPNVLVRNLPEKVHEQLLRRAAREGKSLQQYLSAELERLASRPTTDEVLDRIEGHCGGRVGLRQAADDLAEDRRSR